MTGRACAPPPGFLEPLGYAVVGVQLPSRNLHLDMAFNIVAPGVAVCAPEQLPDFFLRMLEKRRFELVEVESAGVFKHHCNLQCLGDGRVLTFSGNAAVNQKLTALGLEVLTPELTQVLKGGGGPHCMTPPPPARCLREPSWPGAGRSARACPCSRRTPRWPSRPPPR